MTLTSLAHLVVLGASGGQLIVVLVSVFGFIFVPISGWTGFVLVMDGLKSRTREGVSCAECDYDVAQQLAEHGVQLAESAGDAAAPDGGPAFVAEVRCPECGAVLVSASSVRDGFHRINWVRVWVGIGLILVAAGIAVTMAVVLKA